MTRALITQMLEALTEHGASHLFHYKEYNAAITAARAYLEAPDEPVDVDKMAKLGWQVIECPTCGDSARAFPAPEAKQEPVEWRTEVKYGKLYFHIGVQSFPIDYTPEDEPEWSAGDAMAWMDKRLHEALSNLAGTHPATEQKYAPIPGLRVDPVTGDVGIGTPQPVSMEPHLFELLWAEYMPDATQSRAWSAWQAAPRADGVGVAQPEPVSMEPILWVDLQPKAQAIVESKILWKRFIDGTPLANDIACWMADFALEHTHPTPQPVSMEPVAMVVLCHQPIRGNQFGTWETAPQLEAQLITKWENGDRLFTAAQLAQARQQGAEEQTDNTLEAVRVAGERIAELERTNAMLLEACKAADKALRWVETSTASKAWDIIRAAIAKAIGEAV